MKHMVNNWFEENGVFKVCNVGQICTILHLKANTTHTATNRLPRMLPKHTQYSSQK